MLPVAAKLRPLILETCVTWASLVLVALSALSIIVLALALLLSNQKQPERNGRGECSGHVCSTVLKLNLCKLLSQRCHRLPRLIICLRLLRCFRLPAVKDPALLSSAVGSVPRGHWEHFSAVQTAPLLCSADSCSLLWQMISHNALVLIFSLWRAVTGIAFQCLVSTTACVFEWAAAFSAVYRSWPHPSGIILYGVQLTVWYLCFGNAPHRWVSWNMSLYRHRRCDPLSLSWDILYSLWVDVIIVHLITLRDNNVVCDHN